MAAEDVELLTEQRIFGDKVSLTTCQVGDGAENNRIAGRLGEGQKIVSKKETRQTKG